jgi:hypothetical protein
MYAHIKKFNIIIFVVLFFATVLVQSVQGMNNKDDENKSIIDFNTTHNDLSFLAKRKTSLNKQSKKKKITYIHPNSTQTRRSRKVEQLCLEPDIRRQKKFVSEELLKEDLFKEIFFLGNDLKERSESEVLLACLQVWEQGTYFQKENYVHLVNEFIEKEKPDDPFLFFTLGRIHQEGIGIESDFQKALLQYYKASKLGSVLNAETINFILAQAKLGRKIGKACLNNIGYNYIKKGNKEDGLNLLQKASNLGHLRATFNLGYCYHFGIGIEIDLEKARKLYEKAAEGKIKEAREGLELLNTK